MKNSSFPQPICEQIWREKYRLVTPNPDIDDDNSVQDTWRRIANACAEAVPEIYKGGKMPEDFPAHVAQRKADFYDALEDFKYLNAGRITAGAGSGRNVTLFNCYVMGTIPDSIPGIFAHLAEAAITMQQGGGIGYDFTTLRPKNAPVKGVDADASGPLTFMDVWDAMCRTIMSAGSRRGAMMATMRCDHPDVVDFITAKHDARRLRMFNVSVLASDPFMEAVASGKSWALVHDVKPAMPVMYKGSATMVVDGETKYVYEVVKAADLWKLMMENTYNYAEPGVLFIDRINKFNNLWYVEKISATNPCGEQPLPPYGACLLGSLNLATTVKNPFEKNARVNVPLIEDLTRQAVRMLDAVIDISNFPIPEQKAEAKFKRRMGLGITGLADMLFMLNEKYGTPNAAAVAERVMEIITCTAYRESIELAKLFGPCPATATKKQREAFVKSEFMIDMPSDIIQDILTYGIRNALLTSIAPTGTISIYAGNVSSGIEPVFAHSYVRKVLEKDGSKREELVEDFAVKEYREWRENKSYDTDPNPETLVTAQTLTPMDHLVMQAAIQKWTDSSISKTINCPEDITFDDFEAIYLNAYKMGCKGCTTYRPNDVTGSVLSIVEEKPTQSDEAPEESPIDEPIEKAVGPSKRSKILKGDTYKLKWDDTNYYVTINNFIEEDGTVIPYEIFINTQDMSHFQWTTALTRMMSSVMRRGGDISFVIEDLKSIMDPNGGHWVEGKYLPSFIALLGSTLEQHLDSIGGTPSAHWDEVPEENAKTTSRPLQCTKCKGFNVHNSGGCPTCGDCGHSKCG